ncbi:MAG: hypothetical protein R3336_08220, partial [Phycisphaeraceae bacterium]|nr:hypothetical protein [Phycisphaeraceae bacterium]
MKPVALTAGLLLVVLIAGAGLGADDQADHQPVALDRPIAGVNFAHVHRRGHGYGSEPAGKALDRLKQLSVNWIAVTPFAYQPTADSDQLRGFPGRPGDSGFFKGLDPTLSNADLARQIRQAHQRNIAVMLKPHVWSNDFWGGKDQWHGTVDQKTAEG